tara:strand:- start:40060 stop:40704 length:645 start_codon:yes stop_codon:yes gene_type:complete
MGSIKKNSVFDTLSKIDVSKDIKKKGKFNYLPWAVAWHIVKSHYPNAKKTIHHRECSKTDKVYNYFDDGRTAWVEVSIEIDGQVETETGVVSDFNNNSIPLNKIHSFAVYVTLQRAMTKAIALHGLGLSLWIGEDVEALKTLDGVTFKEPVQKVYYTKNSPKWKNTINQYKELIDTPIDVVLKNVKNKHNPTSLVMTALEDELNKIKKEHTING